MHTFSEEAVMVTPFDKRRITRRLTPALASRQASTQVNKG